MRKSWKILLTSYLCISLTGGMTAYGDMEKSLYPVTPVTVQEKYSHIAVSQVTDYVNIREQANTSSRIVGKIYNNCAAVIEETVEGEGGIWYRIHSGTVTGYIKAQYFITGEAAEKLAQSIGKEFATISTDNLRLREQPNLSSNVLTVLSQGARYVVLGEEGMFYKVEVDADLVGYVAQEYCQTQVEFDQAVSLAEEQQRLAEENQRKQEAANAIAALEQVRQVEAVNSGIAVSEMLIAANPEQSDNSHQTSAPAVISDSGATSSKGVPGPGSAAVMSATRTAIVAYAKQFLGNPYVYGGTSLTNGADCSGFTQGVLANFGINTGRSSRDQAENGREIGIDAVQPGDLLFYASGTYINHVALYIGGGQVIHASNSTTGITISPYNYRTPCKAVSFLD
ncbi:MAG: SH3 domain-containing protein [Lachnospiraceae bacterium]|jgi:cell wall-associated NlpC family hydrolase|nr:SH3 domain-containing protein [Lachnospiraceae bacterium]MCI9282828.1 SH3 domain-containing protein [Lachnospiraceae bacterium]